MSCGEGLGGYFKDTKPLIDFVQKGEKSIARLGNRAAVNLLVIDLAKRLGITVEVTTNRLSNLLTITGDEQELKRLLDPLDIDKD